MATFYIEGERDKDYMVVEGMTASEATCYFDTFYGREPRHLYKMDGEGHTLKGKHRTFTVSIPMDRRWSKMLCEVRVRKEGENE